MKALRCVLHAHSTWSYDGHWPLDRIARFYGALGVDAVLMSEHDTGFSPETFPAYRVACVAASTSGCRLIPGIEYSSPDNDIHILTWGLDRFLAEHRPVAETLEAVYNEGGVALFAHPVRRKAWQRFDMQWTNRLHGIELWNRKSDGITAGREAIDLIAQTGLPATVGHDFHKFRHVWPLTMRLMTDPNAPEPSILEGLRTGQGVPMAFGRPLLGQDGIPKLGVHDRLETLRRGLRNRLRPPQR